MPVKTTRARVRARPRVAAFAGVFAAALCCFVSIGTVLPVLPQYVRGPLGAGDLAVGIVTGAFAFTAVLARPIGGRMADASGRRRVVVLGMLILSAAGLLYLVPLGVPGLVFARLVMGVGDGWVFTASATWIVDLAPEERRGQAIGMFGLAVWGGLTIGPLLGELTRHTLGYEAVWILSAALPLLGAAIARAVPDHHVSVPAEAGAPRARLRDLVPAGVLLPGVSLSLANIGYGTIAAFVVLHMAAQGVGSGAAIFTVFAAAVVVGRLAFGHLPDRIGARRAAFLAGWAEAAGLAILALASSFAVGVIGAIVTGIGFSLLFPALALMALERTGDAQRGAALGAVTAFFDIGVGLGAPLAGVAASLAGYPAAFWFAAACAAAGALAGVVLMRTPTRQNR